MSANKKRREWRHIKRYVANERSAVGKGKNGVGGQQEYLGLLDERNATAAATYDHPETAVNADARAQDT